MNNINFEAPFPLELIQLILSKLSSVNLPNCRLVCKAWNSLVLTCKFHHQISISYFCFACNSSCHRNLHCLDFAPKHLEGITSVAKFNFHPKFSSNFISIINSCIGLICCYFDHGTIETPPRGVCILNPMTNEYFEPPIENVWKCCYYGLGFSPKTKHYKLARVSCTKVEIFTFGTSRKWTFVDYLRGIRSHGVYFNGGLFWVRTHEDGQTYTNLIYRLDMEEDEFQEISFPQHGRSYSCFIGIFDGMLYLTLTLGIMDLEYQVWKMEEDFSWTKAFDVFIPKYFTAPLVSLQLQLIRAYKDGKILCLVDGFHLVLYNPKTKRSELFTNGDFRFKKVHFIDSFSFDSLRNILGVDNVFKG